MKRIKMKRVTRGLFMSLVVTGLSVNVAMAFDGIGLALNAQCTSDGRIPNTPYMPATATTPANCTLCHTNGVFGPGDGRDAWNQQNWDFFCVLPQVNTPPVANAGPDQSVIEADMVSLNGSGSSDADGDSLTYSWMFTSIPVGSTAALSDDTASMPTFIADTVGSYIAQLIVNDGVDNSIVDSVTITVGPGNTVPVANAGTDQTVDQGDLVTLDASASSDADSDSLTYSWMFISVPAGSSTTLSSSTAAMPTFTADVVGDYIVQLIVNDGTDNSSADTVSITTNAVNTVPLADAGIDQAATEDDVIVLDGSGSSDADGDNLTYSWSFLSIPAGSSASFSQNTAATPSFTADVFGDYIIQLIVNDGFVDSAPDTVTVKVDVGNTAPVAAAGVNQVATVNDVVMLDGSNSSDADSDALTYIWSFVSKPAGSIASLSQNTVATPSFTADEAGDYILQLIVNDGIVDSAPDTVTVKVDIGNTAPIAAAGNNQSATVNDVIMLDGSNSSDADGDVLTYIWSFVSLPAGSSASLSQNSVATPSFTADQAGDYILQLIVNDGTVDSTPDTVTVKVDVGNTAPVAVAGLNQSATVNDVVMLDGSGSSDADGDILTYIWSFVTKPVGSVANLSQNTTALPVFTADVSGDFIIQLIVNDGTVNSTPDMVTVKVDVGNTAPIAAAGNDLAALQGDTVNLNGSGSSDADGDSLTYLWAFVSKPAASVASLSALNTVAPSFVADVSGDYIVQLIVNDGTVNSSPDTVIIRTGDNNTVPVAAAGMDQNSKPGDTIMLDGSGSSDADGDALTYLWSFTSIPVGSNVSLSDATAVNPTFSADIVGTYVLQLIVNDGEFDSSQDSVIIRVNDQPLIKPNVRLGLRVAPFRLKLKEKMLGRKAFNIVARIHHKKREYKKGFGKEQKGDGFIVPVLVDITLMKPDGTMETLVQQYQALRKNSKIKLKYYPTMKGQYKVKVVVTDEAGDVLKSKRRTVKVIVREKGEKKQRR